MPAPLQHAFRAACGAPRFLRETAMDALVVVLFASDWTAWLDEAHAMLVDAERVRIGRLRRERDRASRTIAYALHRLLLAEVLDCEPPAVPLGRDERGCPQLAGQQFATSLSHGDDEIALAVSHAGPIGVDIEPQARIDAMGEIRASLLNAADAEAAASDDARALLRLWTRKEAVLKASGFGLQIPMDSFAAPAGVPIPLPGCDGRWIQVCPFYLSNHAIAVALAPGVEPQLLELRALRGGSGCMVGTSRDGAVG